MSEPAERMRPAERSAWSGGLGVAVLLLGLTCTAFVAWKDSCHSKRLDRERAESLADRVASELSARLRSQRFLIDSARATFLASDWVSRDEFATLASTMGRNEQTSAAVSLGYIRYVPDRAGELEEFLARTRSDGEPGFTLRGAEGDPGAKEVVEYFAPRRSKGWLGRCVGAESVWQVALEESTRQRSHAVTEPYGPPDRQRFAWLAPVCHDDCDAELRPGRRVGVNGWMFVEVASERLGEGLTDIVSRELDAVLIDDQSGAVLMASESVCSQSPITTVDRLSVGGREWTLRTVASPAFRHASNRAPATVAWGGTLSITVALLVWSLASAGGKARALAESMTAELAEQQARLAVAVERKELALSAGGLGLWDWDIPADYVTYCERTTAIIGYLVEEVDPSMEGFRARLHPDDVERVLATIDTHLAKSDTPYNVRFRLRHRDGSYRWVQSVGHVSSRAEDGSPVRMTGTHTDVTELVCSEERSRSERKRAESLARIISESPNELYIFRRDDFRFVEVNDGAVRSSGYSRDELLRMSPTDLKPGHDDRSLRQQIEPLADGVIDVLEFQTDHRRADGVTYPVQVSLHRAVHHDLPVYVAFVTDLTDLKRLEARLEQARKLESLGQLAAGIAHEINTPMQCVSSNVDFLTSCYERTFGLVDRILRKFDPPNTDWQTRQAEINDLVAEYRYEMVSREAPAALRDAHEASRRVVEIVRAMKALSHPGSDVKSNTDINELLRNCGRISQNRWKYDAELTLVLDPSEPRVAGIEAELSQVFLNLIVNAADAIADTRDGSGALGEIKVTTELGDHWLLVEVSDTGSGVPEAIRERLFDPFFTTKDVGKGTGQGLAIAYDVVVNKHGGTIDVVSTEGQGATFQVRLPVGEAQPLVNPSSQGVSSQATTLQPG